MELVTASNQKAMQDALSAVYKAAGVKEETVVGLQVDPNFITIEVLTEDEVVPWTYDYRGRYEAKQKKEAQEKEAKVEAARAKLAGEF